MFVDLHAYMLNISLSQPCTANVAHLSVVIALIVEHLNMMVLFSEHLTIIMLVLTT